MEGRGKNQASCGRGSNAARCRRRFPVGASPLRTAVAPQGVDLRPIRNVRPRAADSTRKGGAAGAEPGEQTGASDDGPGGGPRRFCGATTSGAAVIGAP
jgi:hypothetical protein